MSGTKGIVLYLQDSYGQVYTCYRQGPNTFIVKSLTGKDKSRGIYSSTSLQDKFTVMKNQVKCSKLLSTLYS